MGLLQALLAGRALARGDFLKRPPLGFHPHVGIAGQHGARDVACDAQV
jgi:hypothetical protein